MQPMDTAAFLAVGVINGGSLCQRGATGAGRICQANEVWQFLDWADVPLLQEVQRRDGEWRRQQDPGHPGVNVIKLFFFIADDEA